MKMQRREAPEVVGIEHGEEIHVSNVNGKAFEVMVTGLYSDVHGSIVRELASNCIDSHIEAKTDRPFEITLPTAFQPLLIVEDFGVGMSEETIKEVFSQITQSTKENSNEALGRWGLGSKTPLAYTDSFTLISTFDGIRSTYTVYRSENSLKIARANVEHVNACNGVKVIVAVDSKEDYKKFERAVKTQLQFLDYPFKVNGELADFSMFGCDDCLTIGNMQLDPTPAYGNPFYVVQGGIGYPIDFKKLLESITDKKAKAVLKFVNNSTTCALTVPIGEVDIPPNRETIRLNEFTIENITKHLQKVYDTAVADIDAILKNEKLPLYKRYQSVSANPMLPLVNIADYGLDIHNSNFFLYMNRKGLDLSFNVKSYRLGSVGQALVKDVKYHIIDVKQFDKERIYVVNNKTSKNRMRIKKLMEEKPECNYVYEFVYYGKDENYQSQLATLKEVLAGYEPVQLSTIEPPKVVYAPRAYASTRVDLDIRTRYKELSRIVFHGWDDSRLDSPRTWDYYKGEFKNGYEGVVIELFNMSYIIDEETFVEFKRLVAELKSYNMLPEDFNVHVANKTNAKKLLQNCPNVLSLKEFVKVYGEKLAEKQAEIKQHAVDIRRFITFSEHDLRMFADSELADKVNPKNAIGKFIAHYRKVAESYNALPEWVRNLQHKAISLTNGAGDVLTKYQQDAIDNLKEDPGYVLLSNIPLYRIVRSDSEVLREATIDMINKLSAR